MTMPSRFRLQPRRACPSVLLISPDPADSAFLRDLLFTFGIGLESAPDFRSAASCFPYDTLGLVITERDLPDGMWSDVLNSLHSLTSPPLLVVSSRLADERLWEEVLDRGGFDVLSKPFRRDEVIRVIGNALITPAQSVLRRPAARSDSVIPALRRAGRWIGLK